VIVVVEKDDVVRRLPFGPLLETRLGNRGQSEGFSHGSSSRNHQDPMTIDERNSNEEGRIAPQAVRGR
jgi:hypothetical protein